MKEALLKQNELAEKIRQNNGDKEATEELFRSLDLLIKYNANKYKPRSRVFDADDLAQEASISMLNLVRTKYDKQRGSIAYPTHKVVNYCSRGIKDYEKRRISVIDAKDDETQELLLEVSSKEKEPLEKLINSESLDKLKEELYGILREKSEFIYEVFKIWVEHSFKADLTLDYMNNNWVGTKRDCREKFFGRELKIKSIQNSVSEAKNILLEEFHF